MNPRDTAGNTEEEKEEEEEGGEPQRCSLERRGRR